MEIHIALASPRVRLALEDERGYLEAHLGHHKFEPEEEHFLPKSYDPNLVIQIDHIDPANMDNGNAESLLAEFLQTEDVKNAHVVFIDLDTDLKFSGDHSGASDEERRETLKRFYRRFGFRSRPDFVHRMWFVRPIKKDRHYHRAYHREGRQAREGHSNEG